MARSAPPARDLELSPTVDRVRLELRDAAVPPAEIITRILARHSEYGARRAETLAIAWPEDERTARAEEWLNRAVRLFQPDVLPKLHGRAVILALALLEPRTGRAAVASGLFTLLADELTPALPEALSGEGRKLLRRLPLAATVVSAAPPREFDGDDVHAVAFNPDCSSLVTGDAGGAIRIVDLSDGRETARIEVAGAVTTLAVSPDGDHLVAGGDFGAGVWTLDGQPVVTVPVEPPVHAVAFAPDIPEVAVGGQSGATTWDIGGVESPVNMVEERVAVHAVAYSPDGGRLAVGLDRGVRLHSARLPPPPRKGPPATRGKAVRPRARPRPETLETSSRVRAIAFSPDSSRIVTGDDIGVARLWDAQALSELAVFKHTEADVTAVAFTADGALLVTASTIPSAHIWSIETGVEVARLHTGSADIAVDIAVSPDGKLLAMSNGPALVWRVGLGGRDFRLSGYTADDARRGADLLSIGNDVDAFAQLIAARTITPPLSIGIFGDWGSGKSFFMNQLKSRVGELAREARDSGERQRDISFYKRIVQVEFNAWHYSESDLWASLVEHILANLRVDPSEKLDIVAERQQRLLDQLAIEVPAADRASKKEEAARQRLEDAEKELERAKREQERIREELAAAAAEDPLKTLAVDSETREAVYNALEAAGLPKVGEAARELDTAAREAQTMLERRKVFAPLVSAPDKRYRFRILVLLLVAAPLIALVAAAVAQALGFEELAGVAAAATGVATLLASAARWVRSQLEWTTQRLTDLDEAAKRLEAPMQQALAEQRQKEVWLEKELEALLEQQRAAQLEKAAQLDRVREVEAELAAATPSRLLSRFLQDRVESDDYRKRLGVLALVRRDFEAISQYLEKQTEEVEAAETLEYEEQDADFRINRIVLYIDDLDRCPPKTVVEVLQAVHLLLAFPLFVVVVAVDVRWVSRSLAKQYPDLLRGDGDRQDVEWDAAAPRDYLEKIFQIPFWIEPLNARASRRMLRGLVGRVAAGGGSEDGAATAVGARSEKSVGDSADAVAKAPRAAATGATGGGAAAEARPLGEAAPPDLNPESLELRPLEITFMEELAPIVGRTPRAVKRYVNTYRLIKATVRDVRRFVVDGDPLSPHRTVMLLLAVETGLRSVAAPLIETILAAADDDPAGQTFRDALDKAKGRAQEDELDRLEAWLRSQKGAWEHVPVRSLAEWADDVARFSFGSGPF
jgi:WD40 repeat protein